MEKLWLAALALYLALGAFDPVCAEDTGLNLKEIPIPGQCPRPIGFGVCAELCSADSDCPKDHKCCSNGCGHACTAIKEITPKSKPGQCPNPSGFGLCVEICTVDSHCPRDHKCCSNGCGRVCVAPIKVTSPKPGYCPRREDIPSILCVRAPCLCEFCSVDSNCPNDDKCCSNACGHVCVAPLKEIPPKPKPGQCPHPKTIPSIVCVTHPCTCEFCSTDSNCPKGQKCCSNACGHVCVDPLKDYKVKPGKCPKLRGGSKLSKLCIRDAQCPGNQKCCGRVCSEPNWHKG